MLNIYSKPVFFKIGLKKFTLWVKACAYVGVHVSVCVRQGPFLQRNCFSLAPNNVFGCVSFALPHNVSVWILDTSDWRTHCLLYFGLSQTRRAEINRRNLFSSLSLGGQRLAYWTLVFAKFTNDQSATRLCFLPLKDGFWYPEATNDNEKISNINVSLFLCKVCSVRFCMCVYPKLGLGTRQTQIACVAV